MCEGVPGTARPGSIHRGVGAPPAPSSYPPHRRSGQRTGRHHHQQQNSRQHSPSPEAITMAGMMRRAAVYLGLTEGEDRYAYDEYEDEYADEPGDPGSRHAAAAQAQREPAAEQPGALVVAQN